MQWEQSPNRVTLVVAERMARGLPVIDLTETNPTRVGLAYPEEELAELLHRNGGAAYDPHPRGLLAAREALAAELSKTDDPVSPEDLVLTASTSESYSHLFKLFADPGDEVLATAPSYPLLDSLTALDGLGLRHVGLAPERRFAIELEDIAALSAAVEPYTKLLMVVHPSNPAGAFLSAAAQAGLSALCASRRIPLVSDEVFADYPLAEPPPGMRRAGPAAASGDAMTFSLGGLSKGAGLPSWKLGWIRVGGPPGVRRQVIDALELVTDSYLSVASPVQRALPGILALAPRIRAAILDRLRSNLSVLRTALAGLPGVILYEPEGGWSAVLSVSGRASDEDLVLALLEQTGVRVHPGYFFDFAAEDFLVVSLLPEPAVFAAAVQRLAGFLGG
ncbi:MAG TPA: pyridoxal phosphate-dependent aminotransferase [Thermoanaerobaculia bacterium]